MHTYEQELVRNHGLVLRICAERSFDYFNGYTNSDQFKLRQELPSTLWYSTLEADKLYAAVLNHHYNQW